MTTGKQSKRDQIVAEARRDQTAKQKTYREKALKMFPWVCGRCGREFSGRRVRELTVHHKDHNHDNNPPDGSNWELLCIYCHDNEHARDQVAEWYQQDGAKETPRSQSDNKPFAALADLLEKTSDSSAEDKGD
ncbi:MAG: YajD family HNH nuclease [Deltaproteobacteria bacterium]|nr:YajD family HNH nuclease [Deltaproteobacteria bacterium]